MTSEYVKYDSSLRYGRFQPTSRYTRTVAPNRDFKNSRLHYRRRSATAEERGFGVAEDASGMQIAVRYTGIRPRRQPSSAGYLTSVLADLTVGAEQDVVSGRQPSSRQRYLESIFSEERI